MRYTLRQLEVFLAVSHYENVTRAADSLALSQSACSGALKDLEHLFDVQLFDRIGKRLQVNELGRRLRPRAEALLEQAAALQDELMRHREVGELRIGATLTIGNYLAVNLITEFMQGAPDARVHLDVANTANITQALLNFDIDLGMIEGEFHHPDLKVVPWRNDELVCFCAPDHPLAQIQKATDKDLLQAHWILREPGSGTRQTFDRAMHGLLSDLHILLELQHTEAIKRAVEANLGISCLSRIALEDAFERRALVPLAIAHRDLSRSLYLAIHKQKYRSAGINRWLKICGLDPEM